MTYEPPLIACTNPLSLSRAITGEMKRRAERQLIRCNYVRACNKLELHARTAERVFNCFTNYVFHAAHHTVFFQFRNPLSHACCPPSAITCNARYLKSRNKKFRGQNFLTSISCCTLISRMPCAVNFGSRAFNTFLLIEFIAHLFQVNGS